ncbi:RdgB/HAM1 family non-canonical purine NTP pyrophosphatase [Hymenobacter sp. UV11]|uniref:RdgB/HAM1 family non-canonical purine NTP pyrophosphatase n=1 Tax=Hymenobacter sp. UV11 TaxID=1849735 RepID=UPI00105E43C6|nr:RdgB/HAM1 family non-canonical purine NTP pyrophosphatase [Hymenobacter sp. UV11]TDN37341.1 non-canonical purine NTP pyrophosphatase, RdgB/HAM1 family [Hymenobacter sp. UV11]TFZ68529.1 RdgB/HAM1 family non-canonical purine NTP pyrophosphatase [Hymenobacter sp. UV11]
MRLCFASNNAHKLDEIRPLLPGVQLLSLADIGCHEELPETQPTLEGNARQKAQYVWDHYGVACFADDTGLEVDALGGEPGVYSARYAGPEREAAANVAKLLHELGAQPDRRARFRTVISLVSGPGDAHAFSGEVGGSIAAAPIGQSGFGYDPVFVPNESDGRTFAEMTLGEKNMLSHRARAVAGLVDFLSLELGMGS